MGSPGWRCLNDQSISIAARQDALGSVIPSRNSSGSGTDCSRRGAPRATRFAQSTWFAAGHSVGFEAGREGRAPRDSAARVLRFDFHWTCDGWRISEVNSDVPGGFSEASELPALMAVYNTRTQPAGNPGAAWADAIAASVPTGHPVALRRGRRISGRPTSHRIPGSLVRPAGNHIALGYAKRSSLEAGPCVPSVSIESRANRRDRALLAGRMA